MGIAGHGHGPRSSDRGVVTSGTDHAPNCCTPPPRNNLSHVEGATIVQVLLVKGELVGNGTCWVRIAIQRADQSFDECMRQSDVWHSLHLHHIENPEIGVELAK